MDPKRPRHPHCAARKIYIDICMADMYSIDRCAIITTVQCPMELWNWHDQGCSSWFGLSWYLERHSWLKLAAGTSGYTDPGFCLPVDSGMGSAAALSHCGAVKASTIPETCRMKCFHGEGGSRLGKIGLNMQRRQRTLRCSKRTSQAYPYTLL